MWALVWLWLCTALAAPNLVLISLDTTRADALDCDRSALPLVKRSQPATPNLCAFAAEGVRFERFYAQAPSTLNSHTTMLSGRDPHRHGVVRNGFPVSPQIPTLTTRLQAAGWDTIAVIGAAALESAMGLNRGFRVYDDAAPELLGLMYQQRAEGVTNRAIDAVEQRHPDKPLFLFVHYFDPHTPYDAPEPFGSRYVDADYSGPLSRGAKLGKLQNQLARRRANPADLTYANGLYLGEVAYLDHHVGRLLTALEQAGVLDEALVVIVGDHGESLNEARRFGYSHGSNVSEGVMRVPLLLRGYGLPLADHAVVQRQAAMSHLAPGLEVALGLQATLGEPALWQLIRPGPVFDDDGWPERAALVAYSEATRPRPYENKDGWNNLPFYRGVRAGGFAMEAAPVFEFRPRLVDDLHPAGPGILRSLHYLLNRWDAAAPGHVTAELAPASRKALETLGYLEPGE